mgnify:CR=1 FL=1
MKKDVNSISYKNEDGKESTIAYSLSEQKKLREVVEQNNQLMFNYTNAVKISNYLKITLILVLFAGLIILYQTHWIGQFLGHLISLRFS